MALDQVARDGLVLLGCGKMGSALLAGWLEAGLPPGVFNVVTGPGRVTGEALALSMEVDALVFTGSGATGRRLLQ